MSEQDKALDNLMAWQQEFDMKEEALKLADELQYLYKYTIDDVSNPSAEMIRKLVAELGDLKHANEEALKLADEIENLSWKGGVLKESAEMIRKLVAELDKYRGKNFDGFIIDELNKQGKPVAWMTDDGKIVSNREKEKYDITFGDYCIPLYTAPQTKPLSDDEIINLYAQVDGGGILAFARAVIKKASEKC